QACELASLAKQVDAKINLIPLNCTDLENRQPSQGDIDIFQAWLEQEKVDVTIRYSKGDDIAAACGQLRNHLNKQD
ncbi:MAG: 23S rRNA (adenine(2503)-C(2))-methyltransferase RlmN, partial [Lentisphaeria bacterium]